MKLSVTPREADILHVLLSYALSNVADINEALYDDDVPQPIIRVVYYSRGPIFINELREDEVLALQEYVDQTISQQSL